MYEWWVRHTILQLRLLSKIILRISRDSLDICSENWSHSAYIHVPRYMWRSPQPCCDIDSLVPIYIGGSILLCPAAYPGLSRGEGANPKGRERQAIITARKRSLEQGNIFTSVCLVPGWGACSQGGCLVETPRDGYCCGRYASYWNAFLFSWCTYKDQTAMQVMFQGMEF